MDIAEIGFKAQTSDLEKAVVSLNKLKTAANGISNTTSKVEKAVTASASAVAKAKVAEADAVLKTLQASEKASKADLNKASSALKVAKAEEAKAKSLYNSAVAADKLAKATLNVVEADKKQGLTKSQVSLKAGGTANDNLPNRFNTANIAAQFQDIGVTAAMGMNPLTVALQQGTQLSAVLNSMQNPLKGLVAAFSSVTNTVSLMTIGIIALVVSLIQMVNWVKFAQGTLRGLADVIQKIGPYALGAAAGLALFYSPAIISGLINVTTLIITMGAATLAAGVKMAAGFAIANPLVLVAALAAAAGAIAVWAVNASKPFREFANVVIGIFTGLGNIIIGSIMSMFEFLNNAVVGATNDLINAINAGLDKLPDKIKDKLQIDGIEFKFKETNYGLDRVQKGATQIGKAFNAGVSSEIDSFDYVGKISQSVEKGLDAVSAKLKTWANKLNDNSAWDDFVKGAERRLATLQAERDSVGLSAEAAAKLKYETELLNEAQQKNITLTESQKDRISQLATDMAGIEEQTRFYKESLDFAKDSTKSFFKDLKNGLQEGKTLWQSFGNAITNVLNKIIDKMIDSSIDMLFRSMGPGGASATSGISSYLFGGGASAHANGNAFDSGGITKFKNGGAFTNSVVNRTTPFAFAGGGSFGVMGEAGPEAVMPLQRGSDGSLGVKMYGSGSNGSNVVVNVNNNTDAKASIQQRQTSQGVEIDVMIDNVVGEKLSKQGSSSNMSLNAYNNRQLIRRG